MESDLPQNNEVDVKADAKSSIEAKQALLRELRAKESRFLKVIQDLRGQSALKSRTIARLEKQLEENPNKKRAGAKKRNPEEEEYEQQLKLALELSRLEVRNHPSEDLTPAEINFVSEQGAHDRRQEILKQSVIQANGFDQCQICTETVNEGSPMVQLPYCMHTFHVECLNQWIASESSCPVCRTPID